MIVGVQKQGVEKDDIEKKRPRVVVTDDWFPWLREDPNAYFLKKAFPQLPVAQLCNYPSNYRNCRRFERIPCFGRTEAEIGRLFDYLVEHVG